MFKTIKNIYCNPNLEWVNDCEISAVVVMKWLLMNDKMLLKIEEINKYTFSIDNKLMLMLISSQIYPKYNKTPFVKYIKAKEIVDEPFDFLLPTIQKYFKYSDNEFKHIKKYVLYELNNDLEKWFNFFGVEEKYYKKYNIPLRNVTKVKEIAGLNRFF